MKKTLLAGLAGLSLAFASGGAFAADQHADHAGHAAPAPAGPSVETSPIVDLVDNAQTKAVLDKHVPGVAEHPSYEMFKGMTLRQVEPMSEGVLDDEKLAAIQADLEALPKQTD